MKYICISNSGEIDNRAFTLHGGSTKRNDASKIGQWGSGNKYAVAYMLRNDIRFRVFSGEREIVFESRTIHMRDVPMQVIYVDGVETSMTIDAGMDWEAWQVFRELYCNALDEDDHDIEFDIDSDEDPAYGVEGMTCIYVDQSSDVGSVGKNQLNTYFINNREPLVANEHGSLYRLSHNTNINSKIGVELQKFGCVFRNGIRVHERMQSIGFDLPYDIDLPNSQINESRVLTYSVLNDYEFAKFVFSINDVNIVRQILAQYLPEDFYVGLDSVNISDAWKVALNSVNTIATPREKRILTCDEEDNVIFISTSLQRELIEKGVTLKRPVKSDLAFRAYTLDEVELDVITSRRLDKACLTLRKVGIEVHPSDVTVVNFYDGALLGMYDSINKRICMSRSSLNRGSSDVLLTLLEECIHRDTGANDYTRHFQDAALQLSVKLIETLVEN